MKRVKKNYMPTLVSAVVHSILFLVLAFRGLAEKQDKQTLVLDWVQEEENQVELANFEIEEFEIDETEPQEEKEVELEALSSPSESAMPLPQGAPSMTAVDLTPDIPALQELTESVQAKQLLGKESTTSGSSEAGEGDKSSGRGTGTGKGSGGGNGATFFGVKASGKSFLYVLDQSSSMQGKKFFALKQELARSLAPFEESMMFNVILFSDDVNEVDNEGLRPATQRNKKRILYWISRVRADGKTEAELALERALDIDSDAIFFLTDGVFGPEVVENITKKNQSRIPIYTVEFGDNDSKGKEVLRQLASRNGGEYRLIQ